MTYLQNLLETFMDMAFLPAFLVLLFLNTVQFLLSLLLGKFIRSRCRLVYENCDEVTKREIFISICTVILNTIVTMVGWWTWQMGWLSPNFGTGWKSLLDFIFLVLAMDLVMFTFHRIGHIPFIYKIMHKMHHLYVKPTTIILFVLNPIETIGFGILWTMVVILWQPSWIAIFAFLLVNITWGTIGHCGAEPFPNWWNSNRFTKYIANASFHMEHHANKSVNFGFYTSLWDRLFGSINIIPK